MGIIIIIIILLNPEFSDLFTSKWETCLNYVTVMISIHCFERFPSLILGPNEVCVYCVCVCNIVHWIQYSLRTNYTNYKTVTQIQFSTSNAIDRRLFSYTDHCHIPFTAPLRHYGEEDLYSISKVPIGWFLFLNILKFDWYKWILNLFRNVFF